MGGGEAGRSESDIPTGVQRSQPPLARSWLRSPSLVGLAFSVLTATAYSLMDITAKLAFRSGLNVPTLLSTRFLGAGTILLVAAGALGARPFPGRRGAIRLVLLGAAGYALESFLLNSSIARMPVASVILIFYAYPAVVAVLALAINKERLGVLSGAALLLSLLGIALLLSFPTQGMTAVGVVLALGAAVAFAVYTIVAEREMGGVNRLVFSALVLLGAGLSMGVIGGALGAIHLNLRAAAWGWILLHMALIGVAVVSFLGAVTHLGATRAAIGNTMEPAITVVLATAFLGEHMGAIQLMGGALLLAAISLLPLSARRQQLPLRVPVAE